MNRGNFSRTIPIILVVIIIIVAIAAIVSIGRSIFSGGGDESVVVEDRGQQALTSVDVTRAVRMTVRGPIVSNERHRSYQVTISPSDRVMTTYEGYLENTIATKSYDNNTPAYEELVYALSRAGMMNSRNITKQDDDTRGICAGGHVYEFEVMQAGRTIEKLWTADCRDVKGSLDADADYLTALFTVQIPDSRELASEVNLPYR